MLIEEFMPEGDYAFKKLRPEMLIKASKYLYEDPEIRPILEEAGIHGDIELKGQELINACLKGFAYEKGLEAADHENFSISVALARLAILGVINISGQEALEFAKDKILNRTYRMGGYIPSASGVKPMTLNEVVMIAKDMATKLKVVEHIAFGDTRSPLETNEGFGAIYAPELHKSLLKYGLVNRENEEYVMIALHCLYNRTNDYVDNFTCFDDFDDPELHKYLKDLRTQGSPWLKALVTRQT